MCSFLTKETKLGHGPTLVLILGPQSLNKELMQINTTVIFLVIEEEGAYSILCGKIVSLDYNRVSQSV